jgi:HD-GYP domain-containing protein (c-di-GMP phosphodiesterase class II)
MSGAPAENQTEQRFFPVPVDALDHEVLQMNLYIKFAKQSGPPTLYRSSGLAFTQHDTLRLAEQKVKFLYVSASQHHVFRKALSDRLDRTFADPAVARAERGRVIREACTKMIDDVLLFPGDAEPVAAVADISRTFADWSNADPEGFTYLLNMSAHDFCTATHMVNVGVGCGLLARKVRPGDRDFFSLAVQGGLLHDVGKRGVPADVLNKEGKLDPEEWKVVSAHPATGFEELRKNPAIPEMVLQMVRDHHERLDGKGYPNGADASSIGVGARICAIVDVFDAITAARPYRGPTPPADSLKIMRSGRGSQFDPEMFDLWEQVVTHMLEADPARAPAPSPEPSKISLESLLMRGPTPEELMASAVPNLHSDNRRRYERHVVSLKAGARFARMGKPLPILLGELFTLHIVDISRGGVQVHTPWPLSIDDQLSVEFDVPGRPEKCARLCRVARVRKVTDTTWAAGLAFVQAAGKSKAA